MLIVFATYGCKKECKGPQGVAGPTGQTGQQGQTGLSNQKVFFGKIQQGSWVATTSTVTGNFLYNNNYVFSSFTNGSFHPNADSATYLIYIDTDGEYTSTNHDWAQMPYTQNGNTFNFSVNNVLNQYINILYTKYDGGMPNVPTGNFDLKMVIITK